MCGEYVSSRAGSEAASSWLDPIGRSVRECRHIVDIALPIADADGIAKLSMRRLAKELDCGVMSLYHYFNDKESLVEALVDEVASEVGPPGVELPWRDAVVTLAEATLEAQLRHPWVVPIWSTTWPGPHRFGIVEALLDTLAGVGLPEDIADLGFHAVANHVQGFAHQRISFDRLQARAEVTGARVDALVADGQFPRVLEHIKFHQTHTTDHDEFRFALELILDGLERHV